MKICKDCKYCEPNPEQIDNVWTLEWPFTKKVVQDRAWISSGCENEKVCEVNPVTGELSVAPCSFARTESGKCGPDGKFFMGRGNA